MVSLQNLTHSVIQWLCVSLLIGISGVQSAQHVFETENTDLMKEAQDFYQKLENHLARDNATLFLLKNHVFFQIPSFSSVDVFQFTVCLFVGDNSVSNCSVPDVLWQPGDFNGSTGGSSYCWKFQWSNSAILASLTIDQLRAFDNVFVQDIYRKVIGLSFKKHSFTVSFHLQSPPCLSETEIEDVLVKLLSWIKAYARASGRPSSWDKKDKGYISKQYGDSWITESYEDQWAEWAHEIRVALLCTFTFLNIFIPVTLAKFSSQLDTVLKPRLTRSHQPVYWGMAITFGVLNLSYLLTFLHKCNKNEPLVTACVLPVAYPCRIPSGTSLYKDLVAALLVKMILFPITLVVDLLIAACIPKTNFPVLCCHFPSARGMECLPKVIHTIALWNIFVFIQIILGFVTIPFSILLFVSPAVVIAYTSSIFFFVLYTIGVLVAFHNFCRQICYRRSRCCPSIKRCGRSLLGLVGTIAGLGIVFFLIFLYYAFTLYGGAHDNGITGILLSLLPSIVISLVGWFIKKKLYDNTTRHTTNRSNIWQELVEMGNYHGNIDGIGSESDEELLPV